MAFRRSRKSLNLNAAFREAGLIEVEAGKVKSWRAITWDSGGAGGCDVEGQK
jgi:hypothetical protein